ncbi:1-acyl-sn-glycerol-3-phosphate acyltransferase [Acidisarcina polymorpha]|uniref:1-acyl-sn-glycerol-3-phosphate acyltransferase n=1 Tax=Acidisarcina polymorpha TaxID=2211140 RepID=A0A2Z5FSK0_9BACT|nr:lysophospholipid acyltransferase family protein [Acidisarcina polymorpha]AXC09446.1 1-acyl-sn-glycerol-3-phosphate acyltransferase [Acidisarcina polymorpha]
MISSLTLLLTYIVLAIPAAVVGIPWTLITGNISLLYRWSMWIVRTGVRLARIRVEVTGRELVPAHTACIFMSNHVSNLDPPILLPLIPGRTSVFLKRSLMKIPVLGYGMKLGDFIPVDRDGRLESAKESVRFGARVLASGVHVMTFVEGTRSRTGKMLPFKKGPFYLAIESGAPVVPISIWGTEGMMKKGGLTITPGVAHVRFHAPLWPKDFTSRENLLAAVRQAMASGLPEWMRSEELVSSASKR